MLVRLGARHLAVACSHPKGWLHWSQRSIRLPAEGLGASRYLEIGIFEGIAKLDFRRIVGRGSH